MPERVLQSFVVSCSLIVPFFCSYYVLYFVEVQGTYSHDIAKRPR
jgi:hypothetical protein